MVQVGLLKYENQMGSSGYALTVDECLNGTNVNPEKILGIVNYPAPTSVHEVRRLVGMVSW